MVLTWCQSIGDFFVAVFFCPKSLLFYQAQSLLIFFGSFSFFFKIIFFKFQHQQLHHCALQLHFAPSIIPDFCWETQFSPFAVFDPLRETETSRGIAHTHTQYTDK